MSVIYVILAGLAPVGVLLWYILRKDKEQPEPTKWLIKAFFYGVISAAVIVALWTIWMFVLGLPKEIGENTNIGIAFANAFCRAAIPEELAKFLALWLLLRKNPYFDEQFDGIVYAVCVGMGFAGLENILYLVKALLSGCFVFAGVSRALTAVPGHFLDAVFMGYYYSLYHFGVKKGIWAKSLILVTPILTHGIYDGILFSVRVSENVAIVMIVVFLVFFVALSKLGRKRIKLLVHK